MSETERPITDIMSYDMYFSKERPFKDESVGFGYDDYIYYINGWLYRQDIRDWSTKVLLEEKTSYVYPFRNILYCVINDSQIISIDRDGNNKTLIYDAQMPIDQFYGNDAVLFYSSGENIYRYHIASKILELLHTESDCTFKPISNKRIMLYRNGYTAEISFFGTVEDLYYSLCDSRLYYTCDKEENKSFYRTAKITFDDLSVDYILDLVFYNLPYQIRETVTADAGIYSPYGTDPSNGEIIYENIEYTVYSLREFEETIRKLFGNNASVNYKSFATPENAVLEYDGEKFLQWNSAKQSDGCGYHDFSLFSKIEYDGQFAYVYDKFMSVEYGASDDGSLYIEALYADALQTKPICEKNDIPYEYSPEYTADHDFLTVLPAQQLFSSENADISAFDDIMQNYMHTFALGDDGAYYWVSSEPIFEE
jgi:hypothetical protein